MLLLLLRGGGMSVLLHSVPIFSRHWRNWFTTLIVVVGVAAGSVARPSVSIRRLVTLFFFYQESNGDTNTYTHKTLYKKWNRERTREKETEREMRARDVRDGRQPVTESSQVLLLLLSRTQRRQSAQSGVSRGNSSYTQCCSYTHRSRQQ